ncbi:MAG: CPBP family intramembrane metalloprotease [Actinomycetota bacterium]|nr:CPBP family intramembrane metalloprotease [Actinomycetota bacterium]
MSVAPVNPPPATAVPARAAWWAVAGVITGLVIAGLLQGVALLVFPGSDPAAILMGEVGLWIGLGGTCVVVSRRFGAGSLAEDFGLRFAWVDLAYGPMAAIGCIVVAGGLGAIFAGTRFAGSNTDIITNQKGNTVGVAIVAVIAALGAPLFEELFFRGLLQRALSTRLGFGAVVVQALLFGLAHFQAHLGLRNVSIVIVIAGVGFVLGCAAWLNQRLGTGIVAHGLFNMFVTLSVIGLLGAHS